MNPLVLTKYYDITKDKEDVRKRFLYSKYNVKANKAAKPSS